jgi:magnesium transporter
MWRDDTGEIHQGNGPLPQARPVWVDVEGPAPTDLLHALFDPHPLAIKLLHGEGGGMGLQTYRDVMVFSLNAPTGEDPVAGTVPVRIALGQSFLLTNHAGEVDVLEAAWRIAQETRLLRQGPDLCLYELLARHLRLFQIRERQLLDEYEKIHSVVLEHPYRDVAHRILLSRRHFLAMRLALRPEQRVVELLATADLPWLAQSHRPYFEDVMNGVRDLLEEVDSSREGLSGTVEAYASLQSNEINKVMKFLTIISVLALPATTIASIYGMNFYIPELHWPFGYWYSLALMGSATGFLLWYMGRHGWFR